MDKATSILRMLGFNFGTYHQKAFRERETSWAIAPHEALIAVAAAIALTALMSLTSCSADDTTPATPQPIHEPIVVSAGSSMAVTRSTTDDSGNTWVGSEKVMLVVEDAMTSSTSGTGTIHDYEYSVSASGTSPSLTATVANTDYWTSTTEYKRIVSAWSFGTTTAPTLTSNTITSYTLPTTQTSSSGELLYSPGAAAKIYTASPNSFSLTFYHQLAKVTFNVYAVKEQALTGATMTVPGSFTAVTTLDDDGSGDAEFVLGSDVTVTPVGTAAQTAGTSTPATYTAVIIPGTYDGKTLLTLTTASNGTYNYIPASLTIQSGKHYTFNITIKNGLMFYNDVAVEAWDTSSGSNYSVEL